MSLTQRLVISAVFITLILLSMSKVTIFSGFQSSTSSTISLPSLEIKISVIQDYVNSQLNITYNFNGFQLTFNVTDNTSVLKLRLPSTLHYIVSQTINCTEIIIPSSYLLMYFYNNSYFTINLYDSSQNATIVVSLVQEVYNLSETLFSTLSSSITLNNNHPFIQSTTVLFLIISILAIIVFVTLRFKKRN